MFGIGFNFGTGPCLDTPSIGLCEVIFRVVDRNEPVENARVEAQIHSKNPTIDTSVLARVKHTATTNEQGVATLQLVQRSQFTRSDGVYLIRVFFPTGKLLHHRYVTIPDSMAEYAEDLPDALGVTY